MPPIVNDCMTDFKTILEFRFQQTILTAHVLFQDF